MSKYSIANECVPFERIKKASLQQTRWESSQQYETINEHNTSITHRDQYVPVVIADVPKIFDKKSVDIMMLQMRLDEINQELAFNDPMDSILCDSKFSYKNLKTNSSEYTKNETLLRQHRLDEQLRVVNQLEFKNVVLASCLELRNQRRVRRIIIPVDEYPDYNFMGLLIGPKGCNHKRLELESGAQISIRGAGSQCDLRKADIQSLLEAEMPLHIHITADTIEKVDKAVELLDPLLDPTHPIHNEYKQKGLKQLISLSSNTDQLINTTSGMAINKSTARCTACGELGHYSFICPNLNIVSYKKVELVCGFCGDMGHVTTDCLKAKNSNLTDVELANLIKSTFAHSNVKKPEENKISEEFFVINRGK